MKMAIIGSRNINDYNLLKNFLNSLNININKIISGGARGVDTLAEIYAKEYNIPIKIYKAEWDTLGKSAGYIRNRDIITNSDIVVCLWDGISKGTKHSLELAKKLNKQINLKIINDGFSNHELMTDPLFQFD